MRYFKLLFVSFVLFSEIENQKSFFLSRFQPNPKLRCLVLDNFSKKNIFSKEIFNIFVGQVRLGQVRLGQVRLGQVRLGQVSFTRTADKKTTYSTFCRAIEFQADDTHSSQTNKKTNLKSDSSCKNITIQTFIVNLNSMRHTDSVTPLSSSSSE